jgi:hypothetical protein
MTPPPPARRHTVTIPGSATTREIDRQDRTRERSASCPHQDGDTPGRLGNVVYSGGCGFQGFEGIQVHPSGAGVGPAGGGDAVEGGGASWRRSLLLAQPVVVSGVGVACLAVPPVDRWDRGLRVTAVGCGVLSDTPRGDGPSFPVKTNCG